jgi:hypothetical protein|tara:strand:- start:2934 stop:3812 length:879 start_codon:yes stop_codon:yes gene_type:complete
MKIKVITSYKPGTFDAYTRRSVESVLEHWPHDVQVDIYHESQSQDIFQHPRVKWIDLHKAQPELVIFKNRWKDDPVANGEIEEIPNGMRRPGPMPTKGSFQWNAVRFANKVFCVTHSIKSSPEFDYIIWLDADTYTFRQMPKEFLENLLPKDTMLTYLGRTNPDLKDAGKDPECGFVGYNLNHPEIQNYNNDWEKMYTSNSVFKLTLGWTDCSTLWHLSKQYQKEKNVKVNDIGRWKGVKGHHVFINSELGLYMDHFKGNRKDLKKSGKNDFRPQTLEATKNLTELDYWKKI